MTERFILIRKPCSMEDEGRYFLIESFDTKEEAEEHIKDSWFGRGAYIITTIGSTLGFR